jgi:hypothetical protein
MGKTFDDYDDARAYFEDAGGVLLDLGFDWQSGTCWWVGPYEIAIEMAGQEYVDSLAPSYDAGC